MFLPSRSAGAPRALIAGWLVVSCVAGALALPSRPAPLALVSTAWPPFTNPAGQPRFALDLVEAALDRLGLTSTTVFVNAPQFTTSLLSGPFDGSAAAWMDPQRERTLLFSEPYLENRVVLVGRHGADVSAKALADLRGRRIAIVEGYSYGEMVEDAGPLFVHTNSEEDSVSRLLQNGVDYTLMDELVVQYLLSNYPKESATKLQIGTTPLLTKPLYFAIRRTYPNAESIVSRFNAQLRDMIADRTYHRLLHVGWIAADVNGDGVPELVPDTDATGPIAPQHPATLFSTPRTPTQTTEPTGFYVGGNIYKDWASVPERYKNTASRPPDPRRSTGTIFKFTW